MMRSLQPFFQQGCSDMAIVSSGLVLPILAQNQAIGDDEAHVLSINERQPLDRASRFIARRKASPRSGFSLNDTPARC